MDIINVINDRYVVKKTISIDSESKTYLVFDKVCEENKMLRLFNKNSMLNFEHSILDDFLRYTKIRHENIFMDYNFDIVREKAVYKGENIYFYTSEYHDFSFRISYTDLNFEERLLVLEQLLRAVSYMHFKGVFYGSLSFSNIYLFKDKGQVYLKLKDIAGVVLGREVLNRASKDSIFYVSAQEYGQLNAKIDIYSLGMMLYYLVTGYDYHIKNLDFEGLQSLDEGIAELVSNSVNVDVSKRPETVVEFWKRACKFLPISFEFIDEQYYLSLDASSSFVAHQNKRKQLLRLINDYFDSGVSKNLIFVRSKMGMGKSRFLNEICYRSRMQGMYPILIEASDIEGDSYPNLRFLMRKILQVYDLSSNMIDKFGPDLLHILPEYKGIWDCKISEVNDADVLHNRICSRILSIIEKFSLDARFVLIVDNVDKLTKRELDLLFSLIRFTFERKPYFLLSAGDMPEKFQEVGIEEDSLSIELGSFNYHDTVNYLQNLLNMGDEVKKIAKNISGVCHGNPRKIEQTILYMHSMGRIVMCEDRRWEIINPKFSVSEIELLALGQEGIIAKINKFSKAATHILNQLAVFSQQVDVFFALRFSNLSGKIFNEAIAELLDSKIIQKTTSDWGNYYEFSDYRISSYVYEKIPDKEKLELHLNISKFYEENINKVNEAEFDSYVFHLVNSNQIMKAIKVLKNQAERKARQFMFNQAIEYYEYALSISDYNKFPYEYILIAESIADLNYKQGNLKYAEDYYKKLVDKTNELEYLELNLITLEKLAELYIFQGRIEDAEEIIRYLNTKICENENSKIALKLDYLKIKIKITCKDCTELKYLIESFFKKTNLNEHSAYKASVHLLLAEYLLKKGDFIESSNNLYAADSILQGETDKKEYIEVLRLYGLLSLNRDNDFKTAKGYFEKALLLSESLNSTWENSILLIDIGHLEELQDNFENAKQYYQRAEKSSSSILKLDSLMKSSVKIAELALNLKDYDSCKIQIEKYSELFESNKSGGNIVYYYQNLIVSAELYLELRIIEHAENLIRKIEKNGILWLDSTSQIKFYLAKLKHDYLSGVTQDKNINFSPVNDCLLIASGTEELNLIKKSLLDITIDCYLNEKFDYFSEIYKKVEILKEGNEKMSIGFKYELVYALSIGIEEMIIPYVEHITYNSFSYSWKIYCILADIQFKSGKFVNALANYIESRGQFLDRMKNIPINYRVERIRNDFVLVKIEAKIIELQNKLFNLEYSIDKALDSEFLIDTLIPKIIKDKEYKKYCNGVYSNMFTFALPTWQKYIKTLDEDDFSNVENLLKFLTQYTIAQFGALAIVNEFGDIVETFSTNRYYDPGMIDYISKIQNRTECYLESKSWDILSKYYLGKDSTKIIFSINMNEKTNLFSRRKADKNKSQKSLLAYVYLETRRVINNINVKSYRNIKKYEALISLVINNYNITKKATIDKLTGVYIRPYVQSKVAKMLEKVEGNNLRFSVLMLDIDRFKDVNDTYGHIRGDQVLKGLGAVLKFETRKSDIVGRYGGEEFFVILMDSDKTSVYKIAEKIRIAVENAKLMGEDRELTISIGAACYPEDGKKIETLIENADKALYSSKHNGRNMVSVYEQNLQKISYRNDNTSGILGISSFEDDRRMNAIIEIMNIASRNITSIECIKEILASILDIVAAKEAIVVTNVNRIIGKRIGEAGWFDESLLSEKQFEYAYNLEQGYFVNWKGFDYKDILNKTPDWENYINLDLVFEGKTYGKLILSATLKDIEFEYNHFKFVQSVSSVLAAVVKNLEEECL